MHVLITSLQDLLASTISAEGVYAAADTGICVVKMAAAGEERHCVLAGFLEDRSFTGESGGARGVPCYFLEPRVSISPLRDVRKRAQIAGRINGGTELRQRASSRSYIPATPPGSIVP